MDLKHKIRTYNFWISLSAAVLIVLRLVGQSLGFTVDSVLFMDIATAVCGVLVVLGIIIMPASAMQTPKVKKHEALECAIKQEENQNASQAEKTEIEAETETAQNSEVAEDVAEVATEQIAEDIAAKTDEEQQTQDMIQLAIEELAKNPSELYNIVKQFLKNNK